MKKLYDTPELEIVEFKLKDVLNESLYEGTIGENIGGGDGDDPIDLEDL